MCFQDDGIQEFLKDAEFYGEDQLYCDHCEDNRDTTVVRKGKLVLHKMAFTSSKHAWFIYGKQFNNIVKYFNNASICTPHI